MEPAKAGPRSMKSEQCFSQWEAGWKNSSGVKGLLGLGGTNGVGEGAWKPGRTRVVGEWVRRLNETHNSMCVVGSCSVSNHIQNAGLGSGMAMAQVWAPAWTLGPAYTPGQTRLALALGLWWALALSPWQAWHCLWVYGWHEEVWKRTREEFPGRWGHRNKDWWWLYGGRGVRRLQLNVIFFHLTDSEWWATRPQSIVHILCQRAGGEYNSFKMSSNKYLKSLHNKYD